MRILLGAGAMPALTLAAAVTSPTNPLAARQLDCGVISGGPGEAAKEAVGNFFRDTYLEGKVCPDGVDDVTGDGLYGNWCGVCDGAALYFNNGHSDVSDTCFTVDDFNASYENIRSDGQTCYFMVKKDSYLQFLYGLPENFDSGGEDPCTNFC